MKIWYRLNIITEPFTSAWPSVEQQVMAYNNHFKSYWNDCETFSTSRYIKQILGDSHVFFPRVNDIIKQKT